MKKVLVSLLVAVIAISAFAQGNILANGQISIAANVLTTTNTVTVGVYDSARRQEWGLVYGIALRNNSAVTVLTTAKAVDLGTATLIGAITTNATTASSLINVVSAPIPAKELTISVVTPSNTVAATVDYFVYGK